MFFGDPYRFAIFVECIPDWNPPATSFHNGLFYYSINGNFFPQDLRTATLCVDVNTLLDPAHALGARPENAEIYAMPATEAFRHLYTITNPESTAEEEYPEGDAAFRAETENIAECGVSVFAVANGPMVRVLAAKTQRLVPKKNSDRYEWIEVRKPVVSEVILPVEELTAILAGIKNYYSSLSLSAVKRPATDFPSQKDHS